MEFTVPLPELSDERLAVNVTPDALRHVRAGHPWIWDGSIEKISRQGRSGELAVIFDDRRKFAAIGMFDPDSPIAIRVLHQGSPSTIDADFFSERLLAALARRQPLIDRGDTTAYRLVHGENDGLPGLVVDRYLNTLVLRLDTAMWLPHLPSIVPQLLELTDINDVVLRTSRRIEAMLPEGIHDGMALVGTLPKGPIRFRENGLVFEADVIKGQKTGHFLDQRNNREMVAARTRDASVLDVFCNTGGFSVNAAAAGARQIHSIDSSPHAIDATSHHMELNRRELDFSAEHTVQVADAFEAMGELVDRRATFDVVIVDPPSFAPNTSALPAARQAYRRLTALAIDLLGAGGTLFQASCSSRIDELDFHDLVADEIDAAGFKATNVIRTSHALDHPITFEQGGYLKATLIDLSLRR